MTWSFEFADLQSYIQTHRIPVVLDKHLKIFWTGQLEVKIPWRQKAVVAKLPRIEVNPHPTRSMQEKQLSEIAELQKAYVDDVLDQFIQWYSSLEFFDDDHQSEVHAVIIKQMENKFEMASIEKAVEAVFFQRESQRHMLSLTKQLCIDDYPTLFDTASSMQRKATVILGPTNSGKTYRALQHLKAAPTGVYLGPLRLLALEVQERLCEEKVPCSLLTGEEQVLIPGAGHLASTIEMMNPDIPFECAVIDEVQMIVDKDRGWAWTQAIVGCPAKHLVIVGSPDAWPVLRPLLQRLNIEVEVIRTERLQPLTVEKYATRVEEVEPGDAYIVFSRKDIFFYQELLGKQGISTAIIYGALGPEVRKAEAARFRNGEAKVLIATDAVGMGLNLPIRRVVFTTHEKFNGEDVAEIDPSLVKQIAGRAGRFGQFEEGLVTALDTEILGYVKECLSASTKLPVQKTPVAPTVEQLYLLGKELQFSQPSKALIAWRTKLLLDDHQFYAAPLFERVMLCEELEDQYSSLVFKDVAKFSMMSLPRGNDIKMIFMTWVGLYSRGEVIHWNMDQSSDKFIAELTIESAELQYQVASIYCWLGRAFSKQFPDETLAQEARKKVATHLIQLLQLRARTLIHQGKKKPKTPIKNFVKQY